MAFVSSTSGVNAFSPSSFLNTNVRATTSLDVAVDPEVATKKEYEDICGVQFDEMTLEERLKKTQFLYPKHVEVLEDFAPMVDDMVDNIVSRDFCAFTSSIFFRHLYNKSILTSPPIIINRNCFTFKNI